MSKQKKFLPLFLSIMILFSILAVADVSSFAVADDIDVIYEEESTDFEEDFSEPEYDNKYGYLTYEVIADEVIITDCDDTAEGEIIVPETIEGHPVTAIGESAFAGCYCITDVVLPDGITEIGARAFEYCNLRNIVLPDSIKEIGAEAFSGCHRLENINIPESVTTLREFVFTSCYKLTEVIVPDNITDVEIGVFSNCMGLEKVILPDSLTKISDAMFNACFNLKEVTIPDTVTEIGYLAFYQCYSLESIAIPESVEKLGSMAFGDIPNLKDIYIYNPDINLVGDSYVGIIEELDGIYNVTSVPEGYTLEEYIDLSFELIQLELDYLSDLEQNLKQILEQYRELIEKWEDIWTHEFHDVRTDLTIHGYDESTAHDFADKNGINFVAFESEEENPDDSQQDNAEDNTCSRCGEVHSNEIEELFCTIKSFFAKIIDFLKSLFV